MKTKKPAILLLVLIMIFMSANAFAAFQDVPRDASYSAAAERLVNLGIFSAADSKFLPDASVTREQFAKIVTLASGLGELAGTLSGTSSFADVASTSAYSGYINVAASKGYLVALADGKFHPTDKVTYAQVCTVLVRMLGYTDKDMTGSWPANYLEKAKALGITSGISLKSGSTVTRSILAVMLDRLLDTNIKKNNQSDQDKTFVASTGLESSDSYLVYSRPEVVSNFNATTTKIGSISLIGNSAIIRNTVDNSVTPAVSKTGESIVRDQIKNKDVVYKVTDKRNGKKYILVVDNKVTGEITSILPDKFLPGTLQLDKVNHEISKYMDVNKINGSSGAYNAGDTVTALLGYDGRVVDVMTTMDQYNENFALVLDNYSKTSTAISDYGAVNYYVKLLHADGTRKTYKLDSATTGYNGKLVKFTVIKDTDAADDYDTIRLESLTYPGSQEYTIDRENGKVGDDYVTDNVVIFNLVMEFSGKDSNARIIKWSDMPDGRIAPDKIKYMSKVGEFGDINVMLVNNILDEGIAQGLVTKIEKKQSQAGTTTMYTVNVNGKEYTTATQVPGIEVGSVVKVTMVDGSLLSITAIDKAWAEAGTVDAIDATRIKVNGAVFRFSDTAAIYVRNYDGVYERKGTNDIIKGKAYGKVSVYMDNYPYYGGKAGMVVITPY